jgi:hypothetical protein
MFSSAFCSQNTFDYLLLILCYKYAEASSREVGWSTMLQAEGRGFESRWSDFFFNLPNPSSRTMALGSTQPLTEMSTRNLRGVVMGDRRVRLTSRHLWADYLEKMWEPRRLTTLWIFTVFYRDSFILPYKHAWYMSTEYASCLEQVLTIIVCELYCTGYSL